MVKMIFYSIYQKWIFSKKKKKFDKVKMQYMQNAPTAW